MKTRVLTLITLMLLSTAAFGQTPQSTATPSPLPVAEADEKKINGIIADLQKLQAGIELLQARLEAAIATAMARQKLSPDEHEITPIEGGRYGFRRKQPPATASAPKPPAKTP